MSVILGADVDHWRCGGRAGDPRAGHNDGFRFRGRGDCSGRAVQDDDRTVVEICLESASGKKRLDRFASCQFALDGGSGLPLDIFRGGIEFNVGDVGSPAQRLSQILRRNIIGLARRLHGLRAFGRKQGCRADEQRGQRTGFDRHFHSPNILGRASGRRPVGVR